MFPKTTIMQFDTGNCFDNSVSADIKNEAYVTAFNNLVVTAVNVSEREMYTGFDKVQSYMKEAKYAFLSANLIYEKSGNPVFKDHIILSEKIDKVGKTNIGVIGLTRYVASMWDTEKEGRIKVADDYIGIARALVEKLEKKTDLIIILAHMSSQDAQRLAQEVNGIDLIVGSFGSERTQTPLKVNNTLISYSGYQGKGIGEVRLFLDKKKNIIDYKENYIVLTKDYPDDPEMLSFVNEIDKKAKEYARMKQEEQRKAAQTPPANPPSTQTAPEEVNPPH